MVNRHLAVAIPASVIADVPHLREKTSKVGLIGRAAAIFRVDEIIIYFDKPSADQSRDVDFVATLLSYMETPQYLRKRLFELRPELQYAGILPPLRTPHHPVHAKIRELKVGEYREGVPVSKSAKGTLIDIGVEKPAISSNLQVALNKRVTAKVTRISGDAVQAEIVRRDEVPYYWGYTVTAEHKSLSNLLDKGKFDLTIATSKFATRLQDAAPRLIQKWAKARSVLLLFGAPSRGLHEIAKDEGANLNDMADFVLNTIPGQGTETVRTEEALLATLAVLNVQFNHNE